MSMRRTITPIEECPQCRGKITNKENGNALVAFDLDGKEHRCFSVKPIGQAILGHVVEGFTLKGRRATIILDGGMELEVRGLDYPPLFLRLVQPGGKTLEE